MLKVTRALLMIGGRSQSLRIYVTELWMFVFMVDYIANAEIDNAFVKQIHR